MDRRKVLDVLLLWGVLAVCTGMAVLCELREQWLGVPAWIALGVSTALHVRHHVNVRDSAGSAARLLLAEYEAHLTEMQGEFTRHHRELEATYREALARHEGVSRRLQ